MIRTYLFLFLSLTLAVRAGAQLLSPDDFLPHDIGQTFTPHYMLVDYVQHVAENSPQVELVQYGETNEKRPLLLAFISTPENLARLEAIRENNLRRAGILEGDPQAELDLAIVWLSFSVHGNEAAGSEASMPVLYELADPTNPRTRAWLENTIVLLDPSINPDGYSRYTHWYRRIAPARPDLDTDTWEHREPWPGGRSNHYLFDLNRDWAWQTQVESRQRLEVYHQWLPHVHVDVHEQGYNSPYYFAPAARPYHPYITEWQRIFQDSIGRNNARYFDEEGWLYFTGQRFDLFYPSYGDTYPTYNGAIGMTYEQGGGGFAGRAIINEAKDTLRLADRIEHHKTSTLATVETASRNADDLIRQFESFYREGREDPPGPYKTFIIRGDNPAGKLAAFVNLLERNHIAYGSTSGTPALQAYNYQTGETESVTIGEDDLVISAYQPLGRLAQILLEPEAALEDSITYDITAWSLPYAYGLNAYAATGRVELSDTPYSIPTAGDGETMDRPYAFLAEWNALASARFLSALLHEGIVVRHATIPFAYGPETYPRGTLIIARADNHRLGPSFANRVRALAAAYQQALVPVATGYTDEGPDLGSDDMAVVDAPNIAVASGEGTSSYSFGQLWYFFEQDLGYPVHIMPDNDIGSYELEKYDLLILPEGRYRLSENAEEQLLSWISGGGRLIAVGSALASLERIGGLSLKARSGQADPTDSLLAYAGQDRRDISNYISGAIFKAAMDATHPLAYGIGDFYFSLKTGSRAYELLEDGWNVGSLGEDLMVSGFAGYKARENLKRSLVFGVEERGRGAAIYLVDNPLYRAFWHQGKFLFSNAVFFAGR